MSNTEKFQPHYTVEDYRQWEGDWELWRGTPVAMVPSPSFGHQNVAAELIWLLRGKLKSNGSDCHSCQAVGEVDWKISTDTILRPDVIISCQPHPKQHLESPPEFIAEILSPSTARKDLIFKRAIYQEQQVRYCAIVDPDSKTVELLTLDDTGEYQSLPANDATLTLTSGCQISLDLTGIFG